MAPDNRDEDSSIADNLFFETASTLLNKLDTDGEAGDRLVDVIDDRVEDPADLTTAVAGGIAAGETVMQLRERSRPPERKRTTQTAIEVRDIVSEDGTHHGTRLWIDDPHAEVYPGDDHVLVRASNGEEFEVAVPRGVGPIQQDIDGTVLHAVVEPDFDAGDGPDLTPAAQADSPDECRQCAAIAADETIPVDACDEHFAKGDSAAETPRVDTEEPADTEAESPADDANGGDEGDGAADD